MEVAAASISVAGFAFQMFQSCVQAFALFNTAQSIGLEGDLFRTALELEKYRLMTWARKVGIGQEGSSQVPKINWQLALMLLEQLNGFLTSAEQLKKRYKLDVSEEAIQDTKAERQKAAEPPSQGLSKLIARLKPEVYTASGEIILQMNSPMKRLRWATVGRDKAKRIISDIADINGKLEYLLDSIDRESRQVDYNRLLRDLVSLTSTTDEVAEIQDLLEDGMKQSGAGRAIQAAAKVKQIRLCIGADRREDEIQPTSFAETRKTIPQLKVLKKTMKPFGAEKLRYTGIEFALYNKCQVLVQWKVAEDESWAQYTDHMKRLTVLLMSLSHESFRSPTCLGYYPAESLGRHGIVFELPKEAVPWSMTTLTELITKNRGVSLNKRVAIARALSETILQLHTAGWMHKTFRSENIVFIAPEGASDEEFLSTESLVMGYDYARPDTVNAALAFTQLPDTELSVDIYRHPQARGLGRETYQKRFDLYALGCVLVELLCWEPLLNVYEKWTTRGLSASIAKARTSDTAVELPSLLDLLSNKAAIEYMKHQVGDHMVDIISTCATAKKAENGLETSVETQAAVVEKLLWCRL